MNEPPTLADMPPITMRRILQAQQLNLERCPWWNLPDQIMLRLDIRRIRNHLKAKETR